MVIFTQHAQSSYLVIHVFFKQDKIARFVETKQTFEVDVC